MEFWSQKEIVPQCGEKSNRLNRVLEKLLPNGEDNSLCIWGVSPILLCKSSQALSGLTGSIAAQLFSGLSRDVRSSLSPGSGWASYSYELLRVNSARDVSLEG
jgi:hypothetical protein